MRIDERKIYFLRRYGSLRAAATALGINAGGLSRILNNHREPFPFERRKLEAALPVYTYRRFFPVRPKPEVELVPWEFPQDQGIKMASRCEPKG